MNIKSIKNRADEVLMPYKTQLIRILTIVLILQAIPSLFGGNNFLEIVSFVLSIVFLPVSHGVIVSSLKIVRNNGQAVNDEDAVVGFKRFKELFPTYIAIAFVTYLIILAFGVIAGIFIGIVFSQSLTNVVSFVGTPSVETIVNVLIANPINLFTIIIVMILAMILGLFIDAYLMAAPYLLEQYHITGFQAVKTSFQMMKGHIMDYLKLFFSFFGWMFLAGIVEGLLSEVISFGVVVTVLVGLFKILTYLPRYTLSETVLFEEIAFYYFNQVGE